MALVDLTLKEACEALAQRAAQVRTRTPSWQEKQATGISDFLGSLGSYAQQHPELAATVAGTGLGGAVGGVGTYLGNREKDRSQRKSLLRGVLTGGLAGGAIGGGLGLARRGLRGISDEPTAVPANNTRSEVWPTFGRAEGSSSHQQLDRRALNEPGLREAVQNLRSPPLSSPLATAVSGTGNVLGQVWDAVPNWAKYLTGGVGAADLAFHQSAVPLGDRFGFGALSPELSNKSHHLMAGLNTMKEMFDPTKQPLNAAALNNLPADQNLQSLIAGPRLRSPLVRGPGGGFLGHLPRLQNPFVPRPSGDYTTNVPRPHTPAELTAHYEPHFKNAPTHDTSGLLSVPLTQEQRMDWVRTNHPPPAPVHERVTIPRQILNQGRGIGARADAKTDTLGTNPGFRTALGHQWDRGRFGGTKTKVLARLATYLGIPVAGAIAKSVQEASQQQEARRRTVAQIMESLRQRGLLRGTP